MKKILSLRLASAVLAISLFSFSGLCLAETNPTGSSTHEATTGTSASKFGVSLGMGAIAATGNRGHLWEVATPMYDLTVQYSLAPQVSLHAEASQGGYFYYGGNSNGRVDGRLRSLEVGTRIYGDLSSILPRLDFMSPFVTVGAALFSKTETTGEAASATDNQLGMNLGAGLKFSILPRNVAFEILGRWNSVNFADTGSSNFASNGLRDLSGQIFSWNGNLLITL